ncbi:hypothetical protein BC940DRAFT_294925 [Gongronella butleri]|nr:hypothetical protein BC940DRAFT_313629 [Gongronella butleri]KAI8070989.1 hypothetical protein BC940DRAFT_294925 [Gongronella butleri]
MIFIAPASLLSLASSLRRSSNAVTVVLSLPSWGPHCSSLGRADIASSFADATPPPLSNSASIIKSLFIHSL